jgi:hypothetical protein
MKPKKELQSLFPIWKKRPYLDTKDFKYYGLEQTDYTFAAASLMEFLGGPDVVIPMIKERLSKTFHVKQEGYDFKFQVEDSYSFKTYLAQGFPVVYILDITTEVDYKGKIRVLSIDDTTYYTFEELYKKYEDDDDLLWDVGNEIQMLIGQTLLEEITNKMGGLIFKRNDIYFTFADPSEFSESLQENIKKIKNLL